MSSSFRSSSYRQVSENTQLASKGKNNSLNNLTAARERGRVMDRSRSRKLASPQRLGDDSDLGLVDMRDETSVKGARRNNVDRSSLKDVDELSRNEIDQKESSFRQSISFRSKDRAEEVAGGYDHDSISVSSRSTAMSKTPSVARTRVNRIVSSTVSKVNEPYELIPTRNIEADAKGRKENSFVSRGTSSVSDVVYPNAHDPSSTWNDETHQNPRENEKVRLLKPSLSNVSSTKGFTEPDFAKEFRSDDSSTFTPGSEGLIQQKDATSLLKNQNSFALGSNASQISSANVYRYSSTNNTAESNSKAPQPVTMTLDTCAVSGNHIDPTFPNNSISVAPQVIMNNYDSHEESPEILSIPTDEIVDSFQRCTYEDSTGKNELPSHSNDYLRQFCEGFDEGQIVRGSRALFQLDRLQAKMSKRLELIQQKTNDEDESNDHKTIRATRIMGVRNLYLPADTVDLKSDTMSLHSSSLIALKNDCLKPSQVLLSGSKSETVLSEESSNNRVKLFEKMLHLLQDVESSRLKESDGTTKTKQNDEASNEYSIAELKLIQKRTDEEMGRILDGLNQYSGKNHENTADHDPLCSVMKKSVRSDCFSSLKDDGPPPEKIVYPDIITSKLSDITSPTGCQEGSVVFLEGTSNNYYNVGKSNEDEGIEQCHHRPRSPKKKRNFDLKINYKESMSSVQKVNDVVNICSNKSVHIGKEHTNEKEQCKDAANRTVKSDSDLLTIQEYVELPLSTVSNVSCEREAAEESLSKSLHFDHYGINDFVLSSSRISSQEHNNAVEHFHDAILKAVSVAEEMHRMSYDLIDNVDEVKSMKSQYKMSPLIENSSANTGRESLKASIELGKCDLEGPKSDCIGDKIDNHHDVFLHQNHITPLSHEQCGCVMQ